jgi:hypothetical protein
VAALRQFYRTDDDWSTIAQGLKLTPCPHCKLVGSLIQHGFLYGFGDSNPQRRTRRARRVFCSNRNVRPGCGRTFSVWLADRIRRLSLSAHTLWSFLRRAVTVTATSATSAGPLSPRTWQRIYKRFHLAQSSIRTALSARCPPPLPPPGPCRRPAAAQVLAHLQHAFPDDTCPIASFQLEMNTFFI